MRKGLPGAQREHFLWKERGLVPQEAGMPMGSSGTLGRSPALPLPGPALLDPSFIFLVHLHKEGYISPAVQDAPQAVSSCIPPGPERKCLHKSSPRRAECLRRSRAIYKVFRVPPQPWLIPRPYPPKSREIFPRPSLSQLCFLGLPRQAEEKEQGGQRAPP